MKLWIKKLIARREKQKILNTVIPIPDSKFTRFLEPYARKMNQFSLLLHMLLACVLNLFIESISRHSFIEGINFLLDSPVVFLYNAFMIFVTLSIVYLFRRRTLVRILLSIFWIVLGIINGYMLSVRVTPFNSQDLKVLGDGLSLLESYSSPLEIALIVVGTVSTIVWLVSMWRRGPIYKGKLNRILAAVGCGAWVVVYFFVTNLALENRVISNYFGNIAFAYEDYGFPYCFTASIFDTGISQPNGYTEDMMMEITNNGEMATINTTTNDAQPNIIFVQLESFFDPKEMETFTMSTDPCPNFTQLASEYSTGYFKAPSIGAGTANTEFEVLTGMSMRYFGPGEYPYKTILSQTQAESAATALDEIGYSTHALHNNGGNFYSRASVFNNMGFDSYTSEEFMNVLEFTSQGWATDDIMIEHIMNCMNSTPERDYVFGITVEGHGSYPSEKLIENPIIEVEGLEDEGETNSWEYYLDLVYKMDQFVANLITAVEATGEPSVIVFYGDHLPTMGIETEDVKSKYLYNTNYVIWDNIGLEKKDQNLAAYQITGEVFDQIGIQSGTVFNYHSDRRKTRNYLEDLELLQYDLLYGEQYSYKEEDILKENHMQMGILDVTLQAMLPTLEGGYSLSGENFTVNSRVYVNGTSQKRTFVNNTKIDLPETELEEGDLITVSQVGSSDTIFRTTATYAYREGELVLVKPVILGPSWETELEDD